MSHTLSVRYHAMLRIGLKLSECSVYADDQSRRFLAYS